MSTFLTYDELVYPQVDELSRSLPWLLPLGPYEPDKIAEIGHEVFKGQRFGVLPTVPYGWGDSVLPLPPVLMERFFESLAEVLEEDGWEDIYLLTPQTITSGCPFEQIVRDSAPAPNLQMRSTAVVPIGHTEQHGFHLTLNTDTVIASGLAQRIQGELTVLPVWPYGVSTHRRQFPGTLTLDARLFEDIWVAVARALASRGFENVFFLNASPGNASFLANSVKFCGELLPENFVYTTPIHTGFGKAWEKVKAERKSALMGHACELETSLMLALKPACVHLDWAVEEAEPLQSPHRQRDWAENHVLQANPPRTDDSHTGGLGSPAHADAARGQDWLQAAAQDLSALVEEASAQQLERKLRRRGGYGGESWVERWEKLQVRS